MNAIKYYRKHVKHCRQVDLANEINELFGTNYCRVDVSRWENGKHKPQHDVVYYIAKNLGIEYENVCQQIKISSINKMPNIAGNIKKFNSNTNQFETV